MRKIVVFGNSGSGKSTFAQKLATSKGYAHLDLDTLAWEEDSLPPKRRSLNLSLKEIDAFIRGQENWVIEGCYSDLLQHSISYATEVVFLNPGVSVCVQNAKNRPWEAHKYDSPAAQNANLEMLISWIEQYDIREDEFSLRAHRQLFDSYLGDKREYDSNEWYL